MTSPDDKSIAGELALNIIQQIPTPVMAVNREMKLIFMNESGLKLLGWSGEDIQGRPCSDVFSSRHCGTADCRLRQDKEFRDLPVLAMTANAMTGDREKEKQIDPTALGNAEIALTTVLQGLATLTAEDTERDKQTRALDAGIMKKLLRQSPSADRKL